MAEILDVFPTGYHEDGRGDDTPCRWVVCVAVADARYLVDVRRIERGYQVTGWHMSEDDRGSPPREPADLDEDVCGVVDAYMLHGGR